MQLVGVLLTPDADPTVHTGVRQTFVPEPGSKGDNVTFYLSNIIEQFQSKPMFNEQGDDWPHDFGKLEKHYLSIITSGGKISISALRARFLKYKNCFPLS